LNYEGETMVAISDNQIIVILSSVFITGVLALKLGKELYQWNVWPGMEGWLTHFGNDIGLTRRWLEMIDRNEMLIYIWKIFRKL